MGSYALSSNASSTAYTNAPIAQENVSNPINLSNSAGVRLGSNDIKSDVRGSTITSLDGGVINRAFDFGSEAVKIIADLSKSSNSAALASSGKATELALNAQESLDKNANGGANADWTQNKTLIFASVAIAIAYFYFKK